MGTFQEELQASVDLILSCAQVCPNAKELQADIDYGRELVESSPELLRILARVVNELDFGKVSAETYKIAYRAVMEITGLRGFDTIGPPFAIAGKSLGETAPPAPKPPSEATG